MTVLTPPSTLSPVPLDAERAALLQRLTLGLEPATLWWLSGYLAGLAQPPGVAAPITPAANSGLATETLTVVYGSQTGNARRVAESLAATASAQGRKSRLLRADAYPLADLAKETQLLIVVSTQGDGDPPDDARGFVEHLRGRRAPKLPNLRYAVLGLGDSSYPKFCEIGRVLDARLAELGAQRLQPLGEADVDIDTVAAPWQAALWAALPAKTSTSQSVSSAAPDVAASASLATRQVPSQAEVLANHRLTGRGSTVDVRHVEFAIDTSLAYQPGDVVGVWPQQSRGLVEAVLVAAELDGDAEVHHDGHARPLREWLRGHRELTRLHRPLLRAHAERSDSRALHVALAERDSEIALLQATPLLDLLQQHPAAWTASDLIVALRPLQPRLYSIASSQAAVGDELHLTVAHERFDHADGPRFGCASHFLAQLAEGDHAPLFIERNERFRLPADASRDVIMIGPGTGVAPFRGFVQERAASAATGRNWLFFGHRTFREDFLYQTEWQKALKAGTLHRLDVAFSRDGAAKAYVQHHLAHRGAELWAWLQNGAHLYVCGDATRMAKDVHATLHAIAQQHGGLDADAAADYLTTLEQGGRYARDVY